MTHFNTVKDLAYVIYRWNELAEKKSKGDLKVCRTYPYTLLYIPTEKISGYSDAGLKKFTKICFQYEVTSIAGREYMRNIKEKQEAGVDVINFLISHLAVDYHNNKTKNKEEASESEEESSWFEKFEKIFPVAKTVPEGLNSEKIHILESYEKISEAMSDIHLKTVKLNGLMKELRKARASVNILKNKKTASSLLSTAKVNAQFCEQEVKNAKNVVVAAVKNFEEMSKHELSRAGETFLARKLDKGLTSYAAKLFGEGKGILIECFDHPKVLKFLMGACKVAEVAGPVVEAGSGIYSTWEAHEKGENWEHEALAQTVKFDVTFVVGGYLFATLLGAALPLGVVVLGAAVIGVGVYLLGLAVQAIARQILKSNVWKMKEEGDLIIANQFNLDRFK